MQSSGMRRCVDLVRADVSEERVASILTVEKIREHIHIPEDVILHSHSRENLKSYKHNAIGPPMRHSPISRLRKIVPTLPCSQESSLHWSPHRARTIHSLLPKPIPLRSFLKRYSNTRLIRHSGLFPHQNPIRILLIPPSC
jgi:hypothetical protein